MNRNVDTILLVVAFSASLAFGVWSAWRVWHGFPPEAPAHFLEIEQHLRVFAGVLVAVSGLGLGFSLAIARGRHWGHRALAWLVTLLAVGAAVVRAAMAPRVVVDSDWPLVLVLSLFAAWCWRRAIAAQTDA